MYTVETDSGIRTLLHMVKSAGTSIHTGIIEASNDYDYRVHVNQRHASIKNLPEIYREHPKYIVIRDPESWYRSFYRFFLGVDGYLSWSLNDLGDDGYIHPIDPNEFVRRAINMKDTLIKFPNKARVFRNLLRSQSNLHFITGYFKSDFHPNYPDSMEQFNCSMYEWFWKNAGGEEAISVPMTRLDEIESLFEIKIPHVNKTESRKPDVVFTDETKQLIQDTHKKFIDCIDQYPERTT